MGLSAMKIRSLFEYENDSTLLSEEEKDELKPKWITTKNELNEVEAQNICKAQIYIQSCQKDFLTVPFLQKLHKKMFGDVWKWAGKFRVSEKNLGVAPYLISSELKKLYDDTKYWIEHKTYSPKEIALRFHHRLVQIHPFPNGNGRISRMMADQIMQCMGADELDWGAKSFVEAGSLRKNYIDALHKADAGDYSALFALIH
jgi:Fic-DOC domain mobile mystery protein B